jgi:hypothetical protein
MRLAIEFTGRESCTSKQRKVANATFGGWEVLLLQLDFPLLWFWSTGRVLNVLAQAIDGVRTLIATS